MLAGPISRAAVCLGLLAPLSCVWLGGCGSITTGEPKCEATAEFQREVPAEGVISLEASTSRGKITVTGYDGENIQVTGRVTARGYSQDTAQQLAEKVSLSVDRSGGLLKTSPSLPPLPHRATIGVSLTILVPWHAAREETVEAETSGGRPRSLHLVTEYGNIRISDVSADLKAISSYGNVDASRINGPVRLETKYGNVTVREISGNTQVDTKYGNVEAASIDGYVTIETKYGKIELELATGDVSARTKYGRASVRSVSRHTEVSSQYGRVNVSVDAKQWDGALVSGSSQYGKVKVAIGADN